MKEQIYEIEGLFYNYIMFAMNFIRNIISIVKEFTLFGFNLEQLFFKYKKYLYTFASLRKNKSDYEQQIQRF